MDFVFSFVLLSYKLADLCNSLFLVDVLEFSIYEIIVSGNRNGFTSFISIYVHFISHYYKIALARTSSITLNRRGKIRLPCLFIILGKSIRHLTISKMLAMGFMQIFFVKFRECPSILGLWSILMMKEYWILPNACSAVIEIIMCFFLSFILLIWCIT